MIVTRDTTAPSNADRLASWLQRSATLRARAATGCDVAMRALNAPPARGCSVEIIVAAAVAYCRPRGWSAGLEREFARVALRQYRAGCSMASSIQAAKTRTGHLADVYGAGGRG